MGEKGLSMVYRGGFVVSQDCQSSVKRKGYRVIETRRQRTDLLDPFVPTQFDDQEWEW